MQYILYETYFITFTVVVVKCLSTKGSKTGTSASVLN